MIWFGDRRLRSPFRHGLPRLLYFKCREPVVLSEELVSLLPRCVANRPRKEPRAEQDLHCLIGQARGANCPIRKRGNEMLVRAIRVEAIDGRPEDGEAFVTTYVADHGDGQGWTSVAIATALEARLSAKATALVSELLLTALEDL